MPSEPTPSNELVSREEVAADLLRYGIDVRQVASVTKLPLKTVQGLQSRAAVTLNPADQELAEAMRNLAWMAYEEAVYLIQFGSPTDRIGLIKLILSRSMGLIGAEKSSRFDEMRTVFEDMMMGIRSPEDTPFDLPLDDDAAPLASLIDTDDPR